MTDTTFAREGETTCPSCMDGACATCEGEGGAIHDDAGTGHRGTYHRDTWADCIECEGTGECRACGGSGFLPGEGPDAD